MVVKTKQKEGNSIIVKLATLVVGAIKVVNDASFACNVAVRLTLDVTYFERAA